MNDEDLKKLLKKWEESVMESFDDGAELKRSIMSAIEAEEANVAPIPPPSQFPRAVLVALAACLALAFGIVLQYLGHDSGTMAPRSATISKTDINEFKQLKSELDHLFPEGVKWARLSDGDMDIATADGESRDEKKDSPVLIRYWVEKKSDGAWRRVYEADVMTAPNNPVQFSDKGESGYLWAYQVDDDVFAVDGSLSVKVNGDVINVEYSLGQTANAAALLKTVSKTGGEYRLYQSISPI